jgi:hypothetical protein
VSGSATDDDELFESWGSFARYPAMLGGTVAGQLVGIAIDAGLGSRSLWIPLVFSVVFEALVGVRYGAGRGGLALDARKCARVSWTYSLVLASVSVPLLVWIAASHAQAVSGGIGYSFVTPIRVVGALVAFVAATAGRAGLMIALVTRRR